MLLRTPFFLLIFFFQNAIAQSKHLQTDVLVVGGGTGGAAAGIQSARSGATTIIVEPTHILGGMLTAAGVSCTDGNDDFHSGIWEEFRQALYQHYGTKNLQTGWVSSTCFEPHVGDSIFKAFAAKEKKLRVIYGWQFEKVLKSGNKVTGAQFSNQNNQLHQKLIIQTSITIDATELGDVFANAGAAYNVGMDDPKETGEAEAKEKNNIIQDITWAAVLKDYGSGADKTIAKPEGYEEKQYDCSTADAPCNDKPYAFDTKKVLNYGKLPNNKYMLNWPIHGNDYYLNAVEKNSAARDSAYKAAVNHTRGFIYFLQTTLGMKNFGLAEDELNHGLASIPYNREGRRVKGVVQLNINHIKNPYQYNLYRTGIGVGNYPVDHHHAQYPGKVPGIQFPKIPAFNIPLGALIPANIDGLIVCEKGISVTNIANGTTRLQPVVLLSGQAAGILAAQSVKKKTAPRNINVRLVQEKLLKYKCYLMPFSDVSPDDPHWEAIQRIGVTGILKGEGKAEGWENKMFFYPDSLMKNEYIIEGFNHVLKNFADDEISKNDYVTINSLYTILGKVFLVVSSNV